MVPRRFRSAAGPTTSSTGSLRHFVGRPLHRRTSPAPSAYRQLSRRFGSSSQLQNTPMACLVAYGFRNIMESRMAGQPSGRRRRRRDRSGLRRCAAPAPSGRAEKRTLSAYSQRKAAGGGDATSGCLAGGAGSRRHRRRVSSLTSGLVFGQRMTQQAAVAPPSRAGKISLQRFRRRTAEAAAAPRRASARLQTRRPW